MPVDVLAIAAHPDEFEQLRTGDDKARGKLTGFFVGQIMKATKGQADGKAVNQLLQARNDQGRAPADLVAPVAAHRDPDPRQLGKAKSSKTMREFFAKSRGVNLLAAALAGIFIPLGLNRMGFDPAVASTVFVTTVTDVVGFFSFLGLASIWLVK